MDVLFSGEEELKVRAMDGLKPKSFSQETKTRCQRRPEIVEAHLKERVQDARRLFNSFPLPFSSKLPNSLVCFVASSFAPCDVRIRTPQSLTPRASPTRLLGSFDASFKGFYVTE
jgi:hypothetical protein